MKDKEETIEGIKEKIIERYKEGLNKIFAEETFELTFEEREKLIDEIIDGGRNKVLEKHIEKDLEKSFKKRNEPDETSKCPRCKIEGILKKDKNGKPKIYERKMETKKGEITIKEYGYECSKCRRIFFPSEKKT